MTARTTIHSSFTIERTYPVSPQRVFAAWALPESKARWFAPGGAEHRLDFCPGGVEVTSDADPGGKVLTFTSTYCDIVTDQRIVYASRLTADGQLATVSLTTVELAAQGAGTHLLLTEQDVFLDGLEQPSWREEGTRTWLAALDGEFVSTQARD